MLNVASVGLYTASLARRRRGRRGQGLALSFLAQGILLGSAWLGGMLVYEDRVGVDHSEQFTGPRDWTPVLDEAELPERTPKRVEVEGKGVLLYRVDGRIDAIGAVCSHAGGPLEKGQFRDGCVQCPWHDSVFDLRNGRVVHGPATRPEASFLTRIRDGRVELRLRSAFGA
jgi:nitrite reductase/ring-hydroxylating ferredoxin subunit